MMRSLIDTENELLMHEQALVDLFQQVARGEAVVRAATCFESSSFTLP